MLGIKKRFISVIYIVLLLTISSCSNIPTSISTTTPASENASVSTPSPVNIPSQTPTAKQILVVTPLPEPLPMVKTQCVSDASASQKLDLQGVVVFEQPNREIDFQTTEESGQQPDINFGFYLFDPNTKQIIKTVNEGFSKKISPNGKYLAYTYDTPSGDKEFMRLLDSNGGLINDFLLFLDGGWQDYYNWQNSEQMRVVNTHGTEVSLRLLNPFTKSHSPLKTDWNNAYSPANPYEDKVADWKFDKKATKIFYVYGANILYDLTLTRVVYPKDNDIVSLVDVETEVELASAQFTDWGRIPSWSPNGEYLTILSYEGNADEFYLISKDGDEFQRITNFSKEFGFAVISEYTWSPDSKQIAFWLKLEDDGQVDGAQSELAILDIETKQVTRLCVQGISSNAYEPWTMNHPEPMWSPDGKYIMFTQWDNPASPQKYNVLVVDPITGVMEDISQNTAPIGWMINEP